MTSKRQLKRKQKMEEQKSAKSRRKEKTEERDAASKQEANDAPTIQMCINELGEAAMVRHKTLRDTGIEVVYEDKARCTLET